MKKIMLLFVILTFVGISHVVNAQSILDFKIVNNTGFAFYGIYLTDENTTEWGSDILPQDIVNIDTTVEVKFSWEGEANCVWDMKITKDESEETSIVIYGIDLCDVSIVTLWLDEDGEIKYSTE